MKRVRKTIRSICRGGISLLAPALLASGAVASESGLVEAGKKQFRRCTACHAVSAAARPTLGPHLEGIVGRTAGGVEGFEYSEVLRDQSFVWDEAQLDEWLEHPDEVLPGMCPSFMGLRKPEDRAALIAFLKAPL